MMHVIIGGGAAGVTAAKEIRGWQPDAQIVMICADEQVHSRCMLHKYLSHERTAEELDFTEEGFFEKNQIVQICDKVVSVDIEKKEVCLASDRKIAYDRLLIATGADSVIPPVGDLRKAENVFGLRHLSDAQKIDRMAEKSENILVIGAGLVGLDAAYGLLERGKKVTIVEMAPRILPVQLDEHGAKPYQELFEKAGVSFRLGCRAQKAVCESDGRIHSVELDSGESIPCDMIIVAAGVRPSVGFLENSGINAERGIEVTSRMETNVKDVYAAGDVTGLSGIWPNAMKQGKMAARNMCGIKSGAGVDTEYMDTFAAKNTINFFGLETLCLGVLQPEECDEVFVEEDMHIYRRAILRDGKMRGIIIQGDISNSGIWQYIIKNEIHVRAKGKDIFRLTFADYFGTGERGKYVWTF